MTPRHRAGAVWDQFALDLIPLNDNRPPVTVQRIILAIEQAIIAALDEQRAELEAARKVADAAVAWHECYNKINEYPAAFYALVDAVREYRARRIERKGE